VELALELHGQGHSIPIGEHGHEDTGGQGRALFAGRRNILIVADHLDRSCYVMDIDPEMCQCVIDRWEKLTGQKAEKAGEP